jgi:predicted GTPase
MYSQTRQIVSEDVLELSPRREPAPAELSQVLEEAQHFLADCGPDCSTLQQRLGELAGRLSEGRFHLAILGQFKRGKSSFLNALLRANILPTSVVPLTAIPTFITYGPTMRAMISFSEAKPSIVLTAASADELSEALATYVTEEKNPRNKLGVSDVRVECPSDLLRLGMTLIDTPGIGSTFLHNTKATLDFLPQCDAALFVVSPDPPISEVEVAFLHEVRNKAARVLFVLNKIDYLTESDLHKTVQFLRQVLDEQIGLRNTPIYCVSARRGMAAGAADRTEQEAEWEQSGLAAIERRLIEFIATEKKAALAEAIARKSRSVLLDARMQLQLSIESLQMPLQQLDDQTDQLRGRLDAVMAQRTAEQDVLEGDRRRLIECLEEQAAQLEAKARAHFEGMVTSRINGHEVADENAITDELSQEVPVFFEQELATLSSAFQQQVAEVLGAHARTADALVDSVRRAAAEVFDIPYVTTNDGSDFEVTMRSSWITHQWGSSVSLVPESFTDRFMPATWRRRKVLTRIIDQIDGLVSQNVENIRWSTLQDLNEAVRKHGNQLRDRLQETAEATQAAIESARQKRRSSGDEVLDRIVDLKSKVSSLEGLLAQLEAIARTNQATA